MSRRRLAWAFRLVEDATPMDRPPRDRPSTTPDAGRIERLLAAVASGDQQAAEELLPIVYRELRELARRHMARERPGQTLQATALVHEAFLRLMGRNPWARPFENRAHFFGAAAQAMRQILVERARRRGRLKRGGGRRRQDLADELLVDPEPGVDLVALDGALDRLEAHDPRKHRVVMLRYFAGLTIEQTAEAVDLSPATVKTDWAYARAWLHRELDQEEDAS